MELLIVRGTPQEIREFVPHVDRLLDKGFIKLPAVTDDKAAGDDPAPGSSAGESPSGQLPPMLGEYIAARARPALRGLIDAFADFLAKEGAGLDIGTSQRTADGTNRYFMAYPRGPRRFGAALYVHPSTGRVDFRLQPDVLTDEGKAAGAFVRPVGGGHPYSVTVMLDNAAKVPVAQQLARLALDAGTAPEVGP